jgi:ectoine hydroxylase-related dioxygenase (phytanoyl-CoA dioxygenase family)
MFDPLEHEGTTFCNPLDNIFSFMFDGNIMDERLNPHILEHADIPVEEGDILIFPSHLRHFVRKNDSKQLRMTVSFNINRVAENTRRVFAK